MRLIARALGGQVERVIDPASRHRRVPRLARELVAAEHQAVVVGGALGFVDRHRVPVGHVLLGVGKRERHDLVVLSTATDHPAVGVDVFDDAPGAVEHTQTPVVAERHNKVALREPDASKRDAVGADLAIGLEPSPSGPVECVDLDPGRREHHRGP